MSDIWPIGPIWIVLWASQPGSFSFFWVRSREDSITYLVMSYSQEFTECVRDSLSSSLRRTQYLFGHAAFFNRATFSSPEYVWRPRQSNPFFRVGMQDFIRSETWMSRLLIMFPEALAASWRTCTLDLSLTDEFHLSSYRLENVSRFSRLSLILHCSNFELTLTERLTDH